MQTLIEKAGVLIEALPYIQQFRGETIVVKFGGSAMEEKEKHDGILADVTFMECVGMRPVIVHGGGKAISQELRKKGVKPEFVKGLRVTDKATMEVVWNVLTNVINPGIVARIEQIGGKARGLRGEDVLRVGKHTETDPETGELYDWGFVGLPEEVDAAPIRQALDEGYIPVITPIGMGRDGNLHNVNADDAAAAVAKALKARKLAFLSDIPGLLKDANDPDSIISTLRLDQVDALIGQKVIDGGMLPKIRGAVDAIEAGVRKVHIVDGRLPHSLLLEIFTDKGVGTEIIK